MSADRLPAAAVALTAVFAGLRLAGVTAWPWWLVVAPLWGLGALVLLLAAGVVATARPWWRPAPRRRAGALARGQSPNQVQVGVPPL